jgi:hypothetical protein
MVATGWRRVFCAVVLSAIVLIALHSHAYVDPLDDQPINGGHHCLLCIAAHLPQAVSAGTPTPVPPGASAVTLSFTKMVATREPQIAFSLYMRPPPAL